MDRKELMVIGEDRSPGSSGEWLEVVNPATEEVHALVPAANQEDVDHAVAAARKAFDKGPWGHLPPAARGKLIFKLAKLIETNADELALLETQDMGKPYRHAREHDLPSAVDS